MWNSNSIVSILVKSACVICSTHDKLSLSYILSDGNLFFGGKEIIYFARWKSLSLLVKYFRLWEIAVLWPLLAIYHLALLSESLPAWPGHRQNGSRYFKRENAARIQHFLYPEERGGAFFVWIFWISGWRLSNWGDTLYDPICSLARLAKREESVVVNSQTVPHYLHYIFISQQN